MRFKTDKFLGKSATILRKNKKSTQKQHSYNKNLETAWTQLFSLCTDHIKSRRCLSASF